MVSSIGVEASEASHKAPSTLASLIAGSVGGASQVIVGQPLDTIKLRAQTAPRGQFSGTWDIARQTFRNEGALAFYKGMASPLLGIAAVNSLLFGALSLSKRLVSPYPDLSIRQTAVAGGMAGAIQSILCSPVERFKVMMQAQYGSAGDRKLKQVLRDEWREHGFQRGIMRGFWITVAREIPAYAGFFGAFEGVKRYFQRSRGQQDLPSSLLLVSGGAGGLAYWTACYPLDAVKSRVQLTSHPLNANYVVDTFRTIVRTEGPAALFRGIVPTYIRAVPAAAVTFLAFEQTIRLLRQT